MSNPLCRNRCDAGRVLADLLERYRGQSDVIVLGLSPGGVSVACEVAAELGAPLDVFPVGTAQVVIRHGTHDESGGKGCHQRVYREGRPTPDLTGRTVILIVAAMTTASETTRERLRREVDEVVCATTTEPSTRGEVHVGLMVRER